MKDQHQSSLVFKSTVIKINPKEIWQDLIELAFINENDEYVTISRTPDEDDLYIEHNDQANFITARLWDVHWQLNENTLVVDISQTRKFRNMPQSLIIHLAKLHPLLEEVLNALKQQ